MRSRPSVYSGLIAILAACALVLALAVQALLSDARFAGIRDEATLKLLALALILFSVIAYAVFRTVRRLKGPLVQIREAALRFASGDLSYRFHFRGKNEFESIENDLNGMAAQFQERIAELSRQRNESKAILDGMSEAVMLLDGELRVMLINPAAAKLFRVDVDAFEAGKHGLLELLRSVELQRIAKRALSSGKSVEEGLAVFLPEPRQLEAHADPIVDESGSLVGLLLVLDDVTRLMRLETLRKDFVANVSHELKTPITSIKGFIETLKDGAIEDRESALKFLSIMERQSDRLEAIIEDLMSLARLEQDEIAGIDKEDSRLKALLDSAVANCARIADEKNITVEVECKKKLEAKLNASLMEQAVTNLVNNAIKFSPEGSRVLVSACIEDKKVLITVKDEGKGIPAKDIPRLFERFYTVDKAHSRALGGTGLGLSIVKHIAIAHGGEVRAESYEGEGSLFTILVPTKG